MEITGSLSVVQTFDKSRLAAMEAPSKPWEFRFMAEHRAG
jgi:hypothetical protein